MTSRPLGSRRTRQEGTTVAMREARGLYQIPPFAFTGTLSAATSSAPWPVTHDIEIVRVNFTASAVGTSGDSIVEMRKNGVLVQEFTIPYSATITGFDVDALGADRFFYVGPGDYVTFACTSSAGHYNFTCLPVAYDNEGR